jgi:DNA-binding transcriptional ArsR family regulator/uncharacterized protein YndB with AHSA1/START domain
VWRALSHPVRRQILDTLRRGPRTTGELALAFPALSRFAVMQHLGVLERASLVLVRREGRRRHNFLNAVPLQRMYERWVSRYAGHAAAELLRITRAVETGTAEPGGSARRPGGRGESPMDEQLRVMKIETEVRLAAPRERVFEAITVRFGEWWPHRIHEGATVIFEPRLGGRCYEEWGGGAGALYAEVTHLEPPSRLCLRGPWGLNRESQVIIWWHVEPAQGGALLKRSFRAWGQFTDELVERYRSGARIALEEHLRPFVERLASGSAGRR